MKHNKVRDQKWEHKRGVWQPVLLEEHVVKEIIERLWWAKIKVWRIRERIPGKGQLSTPGLPDLMGWIPKPKCDSWLHPGMSVPLFIEVKRPGGVRRDAQTRFIEEAKSDGCVAFFAESWDDVVRNLKDAGVEIKYEVGGKT